MENYTKHSKMAFSLPNSTILISMKPLINNSKGNFRLLILQASKCVMHIVILPNKRHVSSQTRQIFLPAAICRLSLLETWPSGGVNHIVGAFGRERDTRDPRFRVKRVFPSLPAQVLVWFISLLPPRSGIKQTSAQ